MTNYEKLMRASSFEELRALIIRFIINYLAANCQMSSYKWLDEQYDDEKTAKQLVLLRRAGVEVDKKIQSLNDLFDEAVERFETGETE